MTEKRVVIPGDHIRLEGLLDCREGSKAGIAVHPHPLYGGSMHNNVVEAGVSALVQAGWTSLRFNFRGVGGSSGGYGDGIGEQDDLAAAVRFLKDMDYTEIWMIAYSFGAHTAAFAWPRLEALGVSPLILIAPPAAMMSFDGLPPQTRIRVMICGEHDEIGPPALAADLGRRLDPPQEPVIIPEADHFFGGREKVLAQTIVRELAAGI